MPLPYTEAGYWHQRFSQLLARRCFSWPAHEAETVYRASLDVLSS